MMERKSKEGSLLENLNESQKAFYLQLLQNNDHMRSEINKNFRSHFKKSFNVLQKYSLKLEYGGKAEEFKG